MGDDRPTRKRSSPTLHGVDSAVLIMGGLTLALVGWAFVKGPDLPLKGVQASLELFRGVWLPLLLGFCLAGFFNVLVPSSTVGLARAGPWP